MYMKNNKSWDKIMMDFSDLHEHKLDTKERSY